MRDLYMLGILPLVYAVKTMAAEGVATGPVVIGVIGLAMLVATIAWAPVRR